MKCVSRSTDKEYHAGAVNDSHPVVHSRCGEEFDARDVQVNTHKNVSQAKRTGKRPCQKCLDELGGAAADRFSK